MGHNIKTIKVGTFNLMNFMLPDKGLYGGTLGLTREEYRRKSEWTEFMLNQMDADIIGFQELFDREAMVRIIKNNPKYRKARLYMAETGGDQPSVALLSRYPVENLEVFTHFPENAVIDFNPKGRDPVALPFTTFTRAVIKADIRIRDYGLITVFVVHLKSKRAIFYANEDPFDPVDLARAESRSLMLRAAESVALRALVARELEIPEHPVILCGDVNDTGNAVTSRIISGEVPQHRLADNVKRRGWELLLYHVKDIQARRSYQDFYYTHIHNGMYESLDQIMVSQELVTEYPRNTGRVGLVSVYNDHLVDQTFTNQGLDKCKSDHGVVVCSLELDLDRAARFMGTSGHSEPEELADSEAALNRLDEERPESDDEPEVAAEDFEAPEVLADAEDSGARNEDASFSVQSSLDKWRRNNPQGGRGRTDNRRRGFDSRNDRGYRRDQTERRPVQPAPVFKQDNEDEEEPPMRPIGVKPITAKPESEKAPELAVAVQPVPVITVKPEPEKTPEIVLEAKSEPDNATERTVSREPVNATEIAVAVQPEITADAEQPKPQRVRKLFRCNGGKGEDAKQPSRHVHEVAVHATHSEARIAEPVADIAKPVADIAKPEEDAVSRGEAPVRHVRERRHRGPISANAEPVVDAAKPADAPKIAEEIAKPMVEAAKPVEEIAKPVVEAAKPVEEIAKPVVEAAKPAEDTPKPVKERRRRSPAQKKTTSSEVAPPDDPAKPSEELAKPALEDDKPAEATIATEEAAKPVPGKDKRRRVSAPENSETVDISGDDAQASARVRTRTRRHRAPIEDV